MLPDTTYEIHHYWRNGLKIDELRKPDGTEAEYFCMLEVGTPVGPVSQAPKIEALNIDDAYAKAGPVITATVEAVKQDLINRGLVKPGIVIAQNVPDLPPAIRARMGPNGPVPGIPGIVMP